MGKTTGANFGDFESWVIGKYEAAQSAAEEIIRESTSEGASFTRENVAAATTKTGLERASKGGNGPGRIDTSTLYDAITATDVATDGTKTSAAFGWPAANFQQYFEYQEDGGGGAPPSHALLEAWVKESSVFQSKMDKLVS